MKIKIFTLFPEMFAGPLTSSLLGKAAGKGILDIEIVNFRDYSEDKHGSVDDYPYGGGAGMVLKPEPLVRALEEKLAGESGGWEIILLTPQGEKFSQEKAYALAKEKNIALICGHYEGFDERIRAFATSEISVGDYILTGGEIPAMVVADAVGRLVPGVIKEAESHADDSFSRSLLEYPQYTRPPVFRGMEVPEVLLSGHHGNIRRWRLKEALRRTKNRRPELLDDFSWDAGTMKIMREIEEEEDAGR